MSCFRLALVALLASATLTGVIRNAIVEKLKLTEEQATRLDKVCTDFATKIDEQKTKLRTVCKDRQTAMEKILTEEQKVKFLQIMKSTGDQ